MCVLCNEKSPPGDMFNTADMPEDNGVPAKSVLGSKFSIKLLTARFY